MEKRVLLTGGTGVVGGEVLYQLLSDGRFCVDVAGRRSSREFFNRLRSRLRGRSGFFSAEDWIKSVQDRLNYIQSDLVKSECRRLDKSILECKYIVHCAGNTHFRPSVKWQNSAIASNLVGSIERASNGGACRLLIAMGTAASRGAVISGGSVYHNPYTLDKRRAQKQFEEELVDSVSLCVLSPTIVLPSKTFGLKWVSQVAWWVPAYLQSGGVPVDMDSKLDFTTSMAVADSVMRVINNHERAYRDVYRKEYHLGCGGNYVKIGQILSMAKKIYCSHEGIVALGKASRLRVNRLLSEYIPYIENRDCVSSQDAVIDRIYVAPTHEELVDQVKQILVRMRSVFESCSDFAP